MSHRSSHTHCQAPQANAKTKAFKRAAIYLPAKKDTVIILMLQEMY